MHTHLVITLLMLATGCAQLLGIDEVEYDPGVPDIDGGNGTARLTVTTSDGGRVTSHPAGIDCPGTCEARFAAGTSVSLVATPSSNFTLSRWSGACAGHADCSVDLTEDRSVSAGFVSEAVLFTKRLDAVVSSVAIDAAGHVVVGGRYSGTVDFGGGAVSSSGDSVDYFFARYTEEAAYRLLYKGGLPESDNGTAVTIAPDDSIHFTASKRTNRAGTAQQDTYPTIGHVAAATGIGEEQWITGTNGNECGATGVTALPDNGGVAVGWFTGALSDLGVSTSTRAGYVTRYLDPGTYAWTKTFTGTAYAVATLPGGDVVVGGYTNVPQTIGGTPITPVDADSVLIRYAAADGAAQVIATISGAGSDQVSAVAVDAAGNLVVVGTFEQTLVIGGDTLTSFGGADAFVAMFSPSGQPMWARSLGGAGTDVLAAVAIGNGDIYVAGSFEQTLPLSEGSVQSMGGTDAMFVTYSSTGDRRAFKRFGATGADAGTGVAVDPRNGIVTLVGNFVGNVDFDGTVFSATQTASFLHRILP